MRKQSPPLSVQIELNEGCNLGCAFCGLRGIRKTGTTPWKHMEKSTAKAIAAELLRVGWHSRLIFAMHGEPTLNPDIVKIIKLFRKAMPNSVFSVMTNGYGLIHGFGDREDSYADIMERISALEEAGINDLIIDAYSDKGDAASIEVYLKKNNATWDIQHLAKGIPLFSSSSKRFRILFTPPIQLDGKINRHLCNHCGAAAPLDYSYEGKRCARPFREMSIRWDGSVAICCNDFRGEYPVGNVTETPIEEVWWSKRFEAARILLYAGERTFKPCLGCNALSHRVGLLPDIKGQETMPEPTDKIRAFTEKVSATNKPLCGKIIKRPWEEE